MGILFIIINLKQVALFQRGSPLFYIYKTWMEIDQLPSGDMKKPTSKLSSKSASGIYYDEMKEAVSYRHTLL